MSESCEACLRSIVRTSSVFFQWSCTTGNTVRVGHVAYAFAAEVEEDQHLVDSCFMILLQLEVILHSVEQIPTSHYSEYLTPQRKSNRGLLFGELVGDGAERGRTGLWGDGTLESGNWVAFCAFATCGSRRCGAYTADGGPCAWT